MEETHGQKSLVGYSPWGCKNQTQPSVVTKCTTTSLNSIKQLVIIYF